VTPVPTVLHTRLDPATFRLSPPWKISIILFVIRRFYVHNFRCLENFELPILGHSSLLLIGNNGAGKTAVGLALEILQRIARGTNRVDDLVKSKDLPGGRVDVPMRFEIEVDLDDQIYEYAIAIEFPGGLKGTRVLHEKLAVGGNPIYTRERLQNQLESSALLDSLELTLHRGDETRFPIDSHLVALPILQEHSMGDPLFIFKQWLAHMLILRPIPSLISGDSNQEMLQPNAQEAYWLTHQPHILGSLSTSSR
jgi:hypothetical protein